MQPLDSDRRPFYDDIQPSTHPSIPCNHPHDPYISGYACLDYQQLTHSDFSTPAVTLQLQTDNYADSRTNCTPIQHTPSGSHGVYADHHIPHCLRSSSFSDGTRSVGLTLSTSALTVSGSIPVTPHSAYLLGSLTSPVTAFSADVVTASSFPSDTWPTCNQTYTAWPPYVADEMQYESPTTAGLSLQSLPDILKPVLGGDYNGEHKYIDQNMTTTYTNAFWRSQAALTGKLGAAKNKEKLRKRRRHRLAQTEDGQLVSSKLEDAESAHSPSSAGMKLSAAVNRSLTASRPSSLLWVQEDVAGSLMNPKGKERGRKEDNKSNKKRKQQQQQQQQPVQQSHKGVSLEKITSRRALYVEQAWEAGTCDGDTDMVLDHDNNSNRSYSVTGHDLDLDTAHTASPRQEIARVKHNKVEQKYRNRLNAHFEALLDVLPPSVALSGEQGFEAETTEQIQPLKRLTDMAELDIPDKERRVSKSEVLDRARMYIQTLENEHKRLAAERKQLRKIWDEYGNANREGQ
ncbi:hypothetical protein NEUTE1DRAFT_128707 [Neurospora tetrasperma FGSC 2508]|uniref:BHLH domain-containing protein n=1 Tax=Neurospora tetrasperma (strain FGSC 2508 / ATCC MYA-4615 / P0657) TaxID=510951 RepID=F8MFP8_NEUT8|nr:uncharacterized protein NEUTE1DRAFT_128707 [Neurospora tetrasperma FGSC 2508]EGO59274.1 hypothetical protein NEUTE1DRAFT_128707 [Neurospora tetrasperma FGSC 2508]EGZ73395.1 hypothetical protein NEUTE2DRAFT_149476 [Neurospora tetrasperma FGSC 2509]